MSVRVKFNLIPVYRGVLKEPELTIFRIAQELQEHYQIPGSLPDDISFFIVRARWLLSRQRRFRKKFGS